MRSVFFMLALLVAVLVVSLPSASAQAGCFPCTVQSCAFYFNGVAPQLSIGATAASIAAAECATLNQDIFLFINQSQSPSCAVTVASLACNIIAATNVSEVNCNTSTIGQGTVYANQTYFQQQCANATKCLGYVFQSEIAEGNACYSFTSFLGAVIAQPTPSTTSCIPCNIAPCYNVSSYATNVTLWTGSLPGITGNACAGQQAAAANLLASGAAGVPYSAVQQTVCVPLALLSLQDTQTACAAGQVDPLFDAVLFSIAAQSNSTWTPYCQASLSQVLNTTAYNRLLQSGYCTAPSIGLTTYTTTYLTPNYLANATVASSSSSSSSSSSTGSVVVVASTDATGANGAAAAYATLLPMVIVAVLTFASLALFA